MRLYEELETGMECERLAPTLHALAHGAADSEALLELRPHLRNCAGCRATVRALHASHLRKLTAFALALIAPARAFLERLRGGRAPEAPEVSELHPMERQEEVDELLRRLNSGEAAVQPIAPSIAESVGRASTVRVNLRGWAEAALQRLQSSDLAIGVHAASTSGGGRITSIAALIGICVSGVGAGTYCVATALLPDPKPAIRSEAKAVSTRMPSGDSRAATVDKTPQSQPALLSTVSAEPRSTKGSRRRSTQTRAAVQQPARDEFSFETGSQAGGSQPQATSTAAARSTSTTSASNGSFESGSPPQRSTDQSEFSDGDGGEFSP